MKTKISIIALLLALSSAAYAQDRKPRPVEPIRVKLSTLAREGGAEFDALVHAELNKLRDVVVTTRKFDYDLYLVVTPMTDGDRRFGYACAALVVEGGVSNRFKLTIHTGGSLESIARHVIADIERDYFRARRRR